ncbi:hypothetical protein [Sulfitobacter sp. M13]
MKKNKRKAGQTVARQPIQESTRKAKVPPPRNLTPPLCERLRRDLLKACQGVAETHGLTVEGGELHDIDLRHGFNISFRVGIPMEDGAIYSPEKAMFEVLALPFGLEPSDYGLMSDNHHGRCRQPPWPVPTTSLAGGAERKTGLPVWSAAPPA